MPILRRIAPELPVFDLSKSLDYYEGKLGFRTVMTMPDRDYAIVERDGVAIHLFTAGRANGPGSIHVFTEGIDELCSEFERAGAHIKQGIVRKPWGNRDFRVLDDFGNGLVAIKVSPAETKHDYSKHGDFARVFRARHAFATPFRGWTGSIRD